MRGLVLLLAAAPLAAQQSAYDRAFDLERRGSYALAATGYRQILADRPAELNALLGLERVLHEMGRPGELAPAAAAAVRADSMNTIIYGVAVRAWTAAGQSDSVRRMVDRWAAVEPGNEAPWREWGFAALSLRDRETARQAYRSGRERLGKPDALAGELAQLATWENDYPTAVTEWLLAIRGMPGYRASAVGMLSQVMLDRRPVVLGELDRRNDPVADQVAAGLAARWNQPLAGLERLVRRLPAGADAVPVLEEFLEEVRTSGGRDAAMARARTMEALAERQPTQRTRWHAEAARAYADAGDQNAARRMLGRLAADPRANPDAAATAGATLVGVLVAEGKLEEADRRLGEVRRNLGVEEQERLVHLVAEGWLRAGNLDRAEALIAADSSVDGLAIRGRARLYRGDLAGATRNLASAGPFARDRADATERAEMLAVLQMLDADSLPALGAAYQALARGDSAGAVTRLATVAASLPPERGGAALYLLAGRVAAAQGRLPEAEAHFRRASTAGETAAAPAARLEMARLMVEKGRPAEAIVLLEQLILDYPASAAAPQARRLLDTVRGGVPGK